MYKLNHNGLTTIGSMSSMHSFIREMWGNEAEIIATKQLGFGYSIKHKVTKHELATIEAMPDETMMSYMLKEKVRECVN